MLFCVWSNLVQFLSKKEKKTVFFLLNLLPIDVYGQNSSPLESSLEVMHPFF